MFSKAAVRPTPSPLRFLLALAAGALLVSPLASQEAASVAPAESREEALEPVTAIDAQAFLGYWLLDVQLGSNSRRFGLLLDDEGEGGNELSGRLIAGFGEMTAEKFAMNEGALAFDLEADLGRFHVEIRLEGDDLAGVFGDTAGSMQAEFTGEKSDRLAFKRFLIPENESRITKGDQMVRLRFVSPSTEEDAFRQISQAEPGEVVRFDNHMAIKLMTDLPLVFDSLVVPTENVAPDYPGVYSLWLKRTDLGWNLVFNHKPDVWGSRHYPSADLGEVPLDVSTVDETSERLKGSIEEASDTPGQATLRLTWGHHVWSVPFRIQQPEGAADGA